jgi:hypothetical protein
MPGEKQNEIKNRLEAMNEVPEGFQFDRAGTWLKLQPALSAGRSRIRAWYWSAAAVLFLFVCGMMFFKPGKGLAFLPAEVVTVEPLQPSAQPGILKAEKPGVVPLEVADGKNIDRRKRPAAGQHMPKATDTGKLKEKLTEGMVLYGEQGKAPDKDTTHLVAVVAPQKAKYRIAHINELNQEETVQTPPQQKEARMVFVKRNMQAAGYEEAPVGEEKPAMLKRKKLFSALVSSSQ